MTSPNAVPASSERYARSLNRDRRCQNPILMFVYPRIALWGETSSVRIIFGSEKSSEVSGPLWRLLWYET